MSLSQMIQRDNVYSDTSLEEESSGRQMIQESFFDVNMPQRPLVSRGRALIVDDEPFNLVALEFMIQGYGFSYIEKAFNGKQALAKVQ